MKKITTFALVFLLLFPVSFTFTACSDDETEELEEKPEENEDEGLLDIPQDVLEKVQNIYSKASIKPQQVKTVHQLAILTSICATRDGDGPISVTRAVLNNEPVTLVTLGGTEEVEGQATTMKESQQASFGKSNDYLTAVTKLFKDGVIPADRPVLVTGISLGGMIAQQLLGVQEITDHCDIRAIITFGSPITLPLDRHNIKVVRFADVHDKVPQLGEGPLRSGLVTIGQMKKTELNEKLDKLDKAEKIVRTSKYTGMIETHALSYIEDPCWNDVDFLGDSEKKNVLELTESMHFYPAPQLNKK